MKLDWGYTRILVSQVRFERVKREHKKKLSNEKAGGSVGFVKETKNMRISAKTYWQPMN